MSLAYTLMAGRDAMDERLGFIVSSIGQLAGELEAYLRGDCNDATVARGKVERDDDGVVRLSQQEGIGAVVNECLARNDFAQLMTLWVRGLELEWRQLYGVLMPQRVGLPTYPFAKKRCWVDGATNVRSKEPRTVAAPLPPFLQRNIPVLGQQSFSATFSGEEPFLIEHEGQNVLPAAAYLEMARVAMENGIPAARGPLHLELRNIAWGRPLVATHNRQVNIVLFGNSDEQVDFEIYSVGQGADSLAQEIVHCQGHAALIHQPVHARLDIENLQRQMVPDSLVANKGGIESIYRSDGQLLAHLQLPTAVETSLPDNRLHPGVLHDALSAAMGLMDGASRGSKHLSLPFALESVRMESACTQHMVAWVRYAQDRQPRDKLIRLDIDLCDQHGNACVQIRRLAYDPMRVDDVTPASKGTAPAIVLTQPSPIVLAQAPTVALENPGIGLNDPQSQSFTQVMSNKPKIKLQ
jgi:acyl transferase domain-containing protein